MQSLIFYIIKYSVEYIAEGNRSMQLAKSASQKGQDFYRQRLFSEDRLALRAKLFENITLPSMRTALENRNAHLIVLTAKALPGEHRELLSQLTDGIDKATIRFCDPIENVDRETQSAVSGVIRDQLEGSLERLCIATVRLDDDDALANSYNDMLSEYVKPEFSGFWVSFPLGIRLSIKKSAYTLTNCYLPKTSQGLARIETIDAAGQEPFTTAYGGGSHVGVDKRGPVILDARERAFIRTNHVDNDSGMRTLESVRLWIQVSAEASASGVDVKSSFSSKLEPLGAHNRKTALQSLASRTSSLLYRSM